MVDDTALGTIQEIENVWITLQDGCRIAARLWLPKSAEKQPVPAILEYIPYRKRDFTRARDEPIHRYFAISGAVGMMGISWGGSSTGSGRGVGSPRMPGPALARRPTGYT